MSTRGRASSALIRSAAVLRVAPSPLAQRTATTLTSMICPMRSNESARVRALSFERPHAGDLRVEVVGVAHEDADPARVMEPLVVAVHDRFVADLEGILPGTDGLLHISEIDHTRTERVEDVLKLGDSLEVKVISIDDDGKVRLSRRVLLPRPEGMPADSGGGRDRGPRRNGPPRRSGDRRPARRRE